MFKSLLTLSDEIQDSIRAGQISIDKGVRLAALKDINAQGLLIKAILTDPRIFTAPTVSKIVSLKNRNPDMSVEECVNRVLKARPLTENRYVFVTSLREELSELSKRKAAKESKPYAEFLNEVTRKSLPVNSIHSFVVHNNALLLILTTDGWVALRNIAVESGIPLEDILDYIVERELN